MTDGRTRPVFSQNGKIFSKIRRTAQNAERRRTEIFAERRKAQNGNRDEVERGGGLMPVSDMTQSDFQYHVNTR